MPAMWWMTLALAQTEVCDPHPVERWSMELAAVREAQQRLQLDWARAWLEAVTDGARCLSEPAPVVAMATLAELHAVQAMYDQDPLALEGWVRQRRVLAPEQPWGVPDGHPIHRFVEEVAEVDALSLPEGEVIAVPKKGGVFVDGVFAPRPAVVPEVPHLVQRFDADGLRDDAVWMLGLALPDGWVEQGAPADPPRWFEGPGAPAEAEEEPSRPTWKAARRDTIPAYEAYLAKEPTGEHAAEARRRIDDLRWAALPKTPEGARAYLDAWPNGRNRGNAEAILQGEAFREAADEGTRESLQLFLGRYPRGVYAAEAQRLLEAMAWQAALADDTEQAYARYRVRWPQGAHREEARLAHDARAWSKASEGGRQAIEAYLRAWPDGQHASEARAFLDGLAFVRVHPVLEGPEAVVGSLTELVPEVLTELGFTVVEESGKGVGEVVVAVEELPMGVDITRLGYRIEVRVPRLDDPLVRSEGLVQPSHRAEELEMLAEAVRSELMALRRWVAQP
jgi:hypothetical protein